MQEAPYEFRSHLDNSLKKMGFIQSKSDKCFYTMQTDVKGEMMLSTHVDDIVLTSPSIKYRIWFEKEFSKIYTITAQVDNNINYLGMVIIEGVMVILKLLKRVLLQILLINLIIITLINFLKLRPVQTYTNQMMTQNLVTKQITYPLLCLLCTWLDLLDQIYYKLSHI
jgi:hypothetical protein